MSQASRFCFRLVCLLLTGGLLTGGLWAGEQQPVERGQVSFVPTEAETRLPEAFRQTPHDFTWQARPMATELEDFQVWNVTFPSPVESPLKANNTVHCEY